MKKFLRIDEVARELDCSKRTVYSLISSGLLVAFPLKKNGSLRIPVENLKKYVQRQILEYQIDQGIIVQDDEI